jgi:DNA-binding MarR family transcriptional regulator
LARAGFGPVMHELEDPMHTVADNAYVAYRSLKARISAELVAPEVDPLCALLLRRIWINGSSIGIAHLRIELALPPSTLSTALRRAEDQGWIRRYPNMIDARYVDAALTHAGRLVAAGAAETISDLEMDVHEAAGGEARNGFTRVATMLALMDDEPDFYKPYDVGPEPDDDVDE